MERSIYDLEPERFTARGVKLVLLDVDNTLSPYTENDASPELISWAERMKSAGLELFILSNNRGRRPEIFARALGLGFVKKARKPFTKAARGVLAGLGRRPEETAIVGDQIYTDTACAKRLGATAVLVKPILFSRFILKFRYWLEVPFRLAGYLKQRGTK